MNKIYRVIWNANLGVWVAVSELAKSHTKSKNNLVSSLSIVEAQGESITTQKVHQFSLHPLTLFIGLMSAGTLFATTQVMAVTGTDYQAGDQNCFYSTTAQSVVCGNATTSVSDTANSAIVLGAGATANNTGDIVIGTNAAKGFVARGELDPDNQDSESNKFFLNGVKTKFVNTTTLASDTDKPATLKNIVIGEAAGTNATGSRNVIIGQNAATSHYADDSVTLGTNANNFKLNGAGDGTKTDTTTRARRTIAIGSNAMTYGDDSVAIGTGAKAYNQKSVKDGVTTLQSASRVVALGVGASASGSGSVAIGDNAKSARSSSVAIGNNAAIEFDENSDTFGRANSVAIGNNARVRGAATGAVAIGNGSLVVGGNPSMALGNNAQTSGTILTAIGINAKALGDTNTAIGSASQVTGGFDNIAAGPNATVTGNKWSQVALGTGVVSGAQGAVAVGTSNIVVGQNSGSLSSSFDARNNSKGGNGRTPIQISGVAANITSDYYSIIGGRNNFAVGNRNLIGSTSNNNLILGNDVKVGADSATVQATTITAGTLAGVNQFTPTFNNTKTVDSAIAVGQSAIVSANNTVAVGKYAAATGEDAVAVGRATFAGQNAVAQGVSGLAGNTSIAVGYKSIAANKEIEAKVAELTILRNELSTLTNANTHDFTAISAKQLEVRTKEAEITTILSNANVSGAVAIGTGAKALAKNAISIGTGNIVSGENSGAIGDPSIIDGANSYSVGNNNVIGAASQNVFVLGNDVKIGANGTTGVSGAVALGNKTSVTQAGGVALGENSVANTAAGVTGFEVGDGITSTQTTSAWKATNAAVSVGTADGTVTRQITGLAAGTNDTDAVNVAQLKEAGTHYFSVNDTGLDRPNPDANKTNYNNMGAIGHSALAAGYKTEASGESATAIGPLANATALSAVALGDRATAAGDYSFALGTGAHAIDEHAIAIGNNSTAELYDVAIGAGALMDTAPQLGVLATTQSTGENTAIGGNAGQHLAGKRNVAVGVAVATSLKGDSNTVVGENAGARLDGSSNTVSGSGAGVDLTGSSNIVSGLNAGRGLKGSTNIVSGEAAGLSLEGSSNIVSGEAAGFSLKGSSNVLSGQSAGTLMQGSSNISSGGFSGAMMAGDHNVTQGTAAGAVVQGSNNINLGYQAGSEIQLDANGNPVLIGGVPVDANNNSLIDLATGAPTTTYNNAVNIGYQTKGLADRAVAVGSSSNVTVQDGVALGSSSEANRTALNSPTVSDSASAATNTVYAAANQSTADNNAIITTVKGKLGAVSVGSSTATRQITNVAAGSEDSDAVNVAQLKAVANTPLGFKGDIGTDVSRNLGETLTVKGGKTTGLTDNNIGVVADDTTNTLTIKLAEAVNLGETGSLTINNTNLNKDGLTIVGGPSVTTTGINAGGSPITNVASGGTTTTNAANIGDVNNAVAAAKTHYYSVNDGGKARGNYNNDGATGQYAIAVGPDVRATGLEMVAIGHGAGIGSQNNNLNIAIGASAGAGQTTTGAPGNNVSIGRNAGQNAVGDRNTFIGAQNVGARSLGSLNTALGHAAFFSSEGDYNTSLGIYSGQNSEGSNNTSLGGWAGRYSSGDYNVAIGDDAGSGIAADSTVSIGQTAYASANDAIAIGKFTTAEHEGAVALGSMSVTAAAVATTEAIVGPFTYSGFAGTTPLSTVSIGSLGKERTLTNVAAGRISAKSTDAINGSQLFATNTVLGNVANSVKTVLGGNAAVGTDGNITMTNVGGTGKATVHDAIQSVAENPLTFAGDTGTNVKRKLGETLNVKGGEPDESKLTDNNIGVVADGTNTLAVKLAEAINLGSTGSVTTGNTKINNDGLTITGGPSVTTTGINAGGSPITNVASGGTTTSNAANIGDVNNAVAAAKTHYYSVNDGGKARGNYNNDGATAVDALAAGTNARAAGVRSTAVGADAIAVGLEGVAIGSGASATGQRTVSVGYIAGEKSTGAMGTFVGAVNTGSLSSGLQNSFFGSNAGHNTHGNFNTAAGAYAGQRSTGANNTSVGMYSGLGVAGSQNTGVGVQAGMRVIGDSNVALGQNAGNDVTGAGNIAIGQMAGSGADALNPIAMTDSVSVGNDAVASADQAIAIGTGAKTSGLKSIGIGTGNVVSGAGSATIGNNNNIAQNNTFVLGSNVTTTQANSVILGEASTDRAATTEATGTVGGITYGTFAGQGSVDNGVVSVGDAGKERQIINVAAGKVSADSTDAINGSQLFATNTVVGNVANSVKTVLGGNAAVDAAGTISMTNIGGTGEVTVHDAIQSVAENPLTFAGDTGTNVERKLGETVNVVGGNTGNLTDNNIGVVADGTDTLTLKLAEAIDLGSNGSVTTGNTQINTDGLTIVGGPSVTTAGINAGSKVISNVKAGGLSATSTDAVNG
ncbi:MAG: ESPR-type extended signal peptide-containing protein, partial [Acinetobacter sp.]|uniref:ESPR-type extended signal peptide-containing protein n=1 Tax=Acinetobacter sp. TaxID=472 RepID=UPI0026E0A895